QRKWKWSLQLRSFDPTSSENSKTLPVSKRRLEGATSSQIFLPRTPTVDFDFFDRFQLPNRRTKLLTPSVAFAGIQTLVNYNDSVKHYAGTNRPSIRYFLFSTGIFKPVIMCGNRCTSDRSFESGAIPTR